MAAELGQHGVGDGADAHLERRTVLDQRCAVAPDGGLDLVRLGEVGLLQRGVVLHEKVDLRGMDHGVAERTGHVLVHHGDHMLGGLHGGERRIDRRAERDVAVFVGRRHLDHRHVARHGSAAVETLRFAQEDGNVVRIAALRNFADIAAHEERVELEDPFEFGCGIGSRTLGVEVMDVHIPEFLVGAALAHGLDEALGSRGNRAEVDVVSGLDDLHSLLGGRKLDLVIHLLVMYFG